MTYLVDSDVLIQAKNFHYGFDFCPAFWDWLLEANTNGIVFSVQKIAEELRDGGDELADWVRARDDTFFLGPDPALVPSLQATSVWVNDCGLYDQAAINTFLQAADYYLVAHAHAHGHVVVTQEVAAETRKRVKIPNACNGMGVQCMLPFEMLRAEGARFVSGA
jgi:Domain of unknown function (DUF4411)